MKKQQLTDGLCDSEGQSDRRIGEGHDCSNNGEPPNLIEVRYLREEDLHNAEEDHVRGAGALAGIPMTVGVEAPSSPDGLHADGRRDGVANGDADEVGVLDDAAEHDLFAAEVGAHGVHVRVVALAGVGVAGPVALGE